MADDHDKHVRFQLAWTLGTVEFPDKADALAKAAVQDAEVCGATLDVLQCAQDAYIRALRAKAGRVNARLFGQQGSQSSSVRGSHAQPGVRREGFSLGVG